MKHQTHPIYKFILVLIFVFLIGYALFNARFLLAGPRLDIDNLDKKTMSITTDNRDFTFSGVAKFSSYITLNDLPITIDESGVFKEKILLSEELTQVKMLARDKFGKEIHKDITIVYKGDKKEMGFDEIISELFKGDDASTVQGETLNGAPQE